MPDFGLIRCESCRLVLPADAYPLGDAVLEQYVGQCIQCIQYMQAWKHGLAASVLRDRATLRRTIALAIDDRVVTP